MKLEEAIEHCESKVLELKGCECGEEHEQLLGWLVELKDLREEIKECRKTKMKLIHSARGRW